MLSTSISTVLYFHHLVFRCLVFHHLVFHRLVKFDCAFHRLVFHCLVFRLLVIPPFSQVWFFFPRPFPPFSLPPFSQVWLFFPRPFPPCSTPPFSQVTGTWRPFCSHPKSLVNVVVWEETPVVSSISWSPPFSFCVCVCVCVCVRVCGRWNFRQLNRCRSTQWAKKLVK